VADKRVEIGLDFNLNANVDKSKIQKAGSEIEKIFENVDLNIPNDEAGMKEWVKSFGKNFELLTEYFEEFEKGFEDPVELPAPDDKKFKKSLDDLLDLFDEFVENADKIELDAFDDILGDLNEEDIEKASKMIEEFSESFDDRKFQSSIKKMAESFSKTKSETEDLLRTQKLALAQMTRVGDEGSDDYKKTCSAN
jgi:uncharacterized protein YaaN involved in tellurite resistance